MTHSVFVQNSRIRKDAFKAGRGAERARRFAWIKMLDASRNSFMMSQTRLASLLHSGARISSESCDKREFIPPRIYPCIYRSVRASNATGYFNDAFRNAYSLIMTSRLRVVNWQFQEVRHEYASSMNDSRIPDCLCLRSSYQWLRSDSILRQRRKFCIMHFLSFIHGIQ